MINYKLKFHINYLVKSLLMYNNIDEDYVGPTPYFSGDSFDTLVLPEGFTCPSQEELETSALTLINEEEWKSVRKLRNDLLSETDWIVTKSTETKSTISPEWLKYRQELRDLTNQSDPYNIVWPTKPE